jgi:hypothetical protein
LAAEAASFALTSISELVVILLSFSCFDHVREGLYHSTKKATTSKMANAWMESNYEISHRTMGFGRKSYILAASFNCGMVLLPDIATGVC